MARGQLLSSVQTPIQRIDLERLPDGEFALYLDDHIQFVSGHDDMAYHGALATQPAAALSNTPIRALILGGGDGLAARNLLTEGVASEVVLVEIDRGMLEFCSTHPVLRKLNRDVFRDPRLKAKVGDARDFVASQPQAWFDLAVVDFPDPTPDLLDLYRWPFYASLLGHMNPERHAIAVQASSADSPTQEYVAANLEQATGTPAQRIEFNGKHMDDGVVVVSRRGC